MQIILSACGSVRSMRVLGEISKPERKGEPATADYCKPEKSGAIGQPSKLSIISGGSSITRNHAVDLEDTNSGRDWHKPRCWKNWRGTQYRPIAR